MKLKSPDVECDSLELYAFLVAGRLPGVGAVTFQNLLVECPQLSDLFRFPSQRLLALGLRSQAIDALRSISLQALAQLDPSHALLASVARDVQWAAEPDQHLVCLNDVRYPALLKEIHDPPACLYVKGQADVLNRPQLAVIGSRNPSQNGLLNTRNFSRYLAQQGWVISSGLAMGIDGEAHQAALDVGGLTVAVMGHGLDFLYPKQHGALAQAISNCGALVSEYPIGTAPKPHLFARRNRIISGLSQGVLVVEATLKSGSLITAQMALEQGREVFAIPGSIHNPLSRGCHKLIKEGATLVESGEDIFNHLGVFEAPAPPLRQLRKQREVPAHQQDAFAASDNAQPTSSLPLSAQEQQLLRFIDLEPAPVDLIVERSSLEVSQVASLLILLELKDLVYQEGGAYARRVL